MKTEHRSLSFESYEIRILIIKVRVSVVELTCRKYFSGQTLLVFIEFFQQSIRPHFYVTNNTHNIHNTHTIHITIIGKQIMSRTPTDHKAFYTH